jgi:hypothetical protein
MLTGVYKRGTSTVYGANNAFSTYYGRWGFEEMNR